ncbi:MAG: antitoxin Xre/MbcA/ParS toxin-binding domain-containing protein [Flavobacteriales bacterium]
MKNLKINDAVISYQSIDDRDILTLVDAVRAGLKYSFFDALTHNFPFSLNEWGNFLHLSPRSIQRYKKDKKAFDPIHSEKILQITLLYKKGEEVFESKEDFNTWLALENIALGGRKPKNLLDNAFGIQLLNDELTRIEHGVLV